MKIFLTFLIVFISGVNIYSQYDDTGRRGIYFSKKEYIEESIPTFETIKDKLPSPVLEDNKDWIELYW